MEWYNRVPDYQKETIELRRIVDFGSRSDDLEEKR